MQDVNDMCVSYKEMGILDGADRKKLWKRNPVMHVVGAIVVVFLMCSTGFAEPVKVWPVNPHYLMFKGKPLLLITSDHHYGAVIDRDFNYTNFLAYLGKNRMNLTRIYPGSMFEPPNKFLLGNPLGPMSGRQILPWLRSTQTGAHPSLAEPGQPSYKYDLDRWSPDYFARLRSFVEMAGKFDIIVEVAFFNGMYPDCWPLMPFYHANNIQGVGQYEAKDCRLFCTTDTRNIDVLARQKAYVQKITVELNAFDNVIYDLCDEPCIAGASDSAVTSWLRALKDAFLETEQALPKKHILGQTVQSMSPDLSKDAWCNWLPTEYVAPARAAFEKDYAANKPIVNVESDYYGFGNVKPYTVDDVRVEGWWFMVGGGAGFINLNGEYYRGHETGGPDTQTRIVPEKKVLRDFLETLNLAKLSRFTNFGALPSGLVASGVAEPGKEYAIYLFHNQKDAQSWAHFSVKQGVFEDSFTLGAIPAGDYHLDWINPTTGTAQRTETNAHSGGDLRVQTPPYTIDVALRMQRITGAR